jgi:hypothetical protein
MSVERSGQAIYVETLKGQLETGGIRGFDGGRQLSTDGTSRMNREVQVRICEGLGVKFPGPTRRAKFADRAASSFSSESAVCAAAKRGSAPDTASRTHSPFWPQSKTLDLSPNAKWLQHDQVDTLRDDLDLVENFFKSCPRTLTEYF